MELGTRSSYMKWTGKCDISENYYLS